MPESSEQEEIIVVPPNDPNAQHEDVNSDSALVKHLTAQLIPLFERHCFSNYFDWLPTEIFWKVLLHLPPTELARMKRTHLRAYFTCIDPAFIKRYADRWYVDGLHIPGHYDVLWQMDTLLAGAPLSTIDVLRKLSSGIPLTNAAYQAASDFIDKHGNTLLLWTIAADAKNNLKNQEITIEATLQFVLNENNNKMNALDLIAKNGSRTFLEYAFNTEISNVTNVTTAMLRHCIKHNRIDLIPKELLTLDNLERTYSVDVMINDTVSKVKINLMLYTALVGNYDFFKQLIAHYKSLIPTEYNDAIAVNRTMTQKRVALAEDKAAPSKYRKALYRLDLAGESPLGLLQFAAISNEPKFFDIYEEWRRDIWLDLPQNPAYSAEANFDNHSLTAPIMLAIKHNNKEAFSYLVDRLDDDHLNNIYQGRVRSGTLLHWLINYPEACESGMLDMVLDRKPNLNSIAGDWDTTPIQHAIMQKNLVAIEKLIAAGADITARDNRGYDAIWYLQSSQLKYNTNEFYHTTKLLNRGNHTYRGIAAVYIKNIYNTIQQNHNSWFELAVIGLKLTAWTMKFTTLTTEAILLGFGASAVVASAAATIIALAATVTAAVTLVYIASAIKPYADQVFGHVWATLLTPFSILSNSHHVVREVAEDTYQFSKNTVGKVKESKLCSDFLFWKNVDKEPDIIDSILEADDFAPDKLQIPVLAN